jgi:precorrin-6B methylase 2
VLALALSIVSTSLFAQAQPATQKPFQPTVGQQGKDVVWVPTPDALVAKMLDLAKVTPQDYVIDLGSGDGRTVIAAAKRGAKALGIEYNPDMVELSKRNQAAAGVAADKASFMQADLFATDFSQATVVTMFLLPTINLKLRPAILKMKPGTRIVSNTFTMDDWQPDQTATITQEQGCTTWCTALFWIVPAQVDGAWRIGDSDLTIKQSFQMLSGTLRTGSSSVEISDAKMTGDQIAFTAGGAKYTGRVTGTSMQGSVTGSRTGNWTGTKR